MTYNALHFEYSSALWLGVLIFTFIIVALGLLINGSFLLVVYRVADMRTNINIYLVNLAIADLSTQVLYIIRHVGGYILAYGLKYGNPTKYGCAAINFLAYLFYYVSLWTVTFLGLERYIAICHPLRHRSINPRAQALRMVLTAWLISIIFAAFVTPQKPVDLCVISKDEQMFSIQLQVCRFICTSCWDAVTATDFTQFVTAVTASTIFYSLIISRLGKSNPSDDAIAKNTCKTRKAVAKMLIINGVVFFLCNVPYAYLNLTDFFRIRVFNRSVDIITLWIARLLYLVNSMVNPIIYSLICHRYRKAYMKAFKLKQPTTSSRTTRTAAAAPSPPTTTFNNQYQKHTMVATFGLVTYLGHNRHTPDDNSVSCHKLKPT